MTPGDDDSPGSAFGGFRVSWGTGIWILLLTLAVWIFFYVKQEQLDSASTSVVALTVTAAVVASQWVWSRIRQSREGRGGRAK